MLTSGTRFPIGESDFRNLRRRGFVYVDKTNFIEKVINANASVILLPRPRRFGKTLNLSALRYFLEKSDEERTDLFEGLAIAASDIARPHFQRYPVLFLTLKDLKCQDWESCFRGLTGLLSELYQQHAYVLESGKLTEAENKIFRAIIAETASAEHCGAALRNLSRYLHEYHQIPTVILVDEYDSPLHSAYTNGYYDQAISFFRNFLSAAFKDNPHLFKGVLTGILRVAKESIFSGLNNLAVYSLMRSEFATAFGFTEAEVKQLTEQIQQPELLESLRAWYNGYLFSDQVIYNPWSILCFLDSEDKVLRPYWVQTSSNELIRDVLFQSSLTVREELETLLTGGRIIKPIHDNIVLRDLPQQSDQAIWNFLLFSGYLTVRSSFTKEYELYGELELPNREVISEFRRMTRGWFETQMGISINLQQFFQALLQGDAKKIQRYLEHLLTVNASYHDFPNSAGEATYHAFLLGVLVNLSADYEVRSNRESGHGRADLMVLPKKRGDAGVVVELKVLDDDDEAIVETTLGAALQQLHKNQYVAELVERGANPISALAVVFCGKQVWVKK